MRLEPGAVIRRATRTADGPATVALELRRDVVRVTAWGAGAERAIEGVPALIGLLDDPTPFVAHHPLLAELARRMPGLRLGRTGSNWEVLLPAILEQKVTGREAWRGYRGLVRVHGDTAPGPGLLRGAPAAKVVAAM